MSPTEFLIDTIKHYNSENRCFGKHYCTYSPLSSGKEGKSEGCAIGRHLDPEVAYQIDKDHRTSSGEYACASISKKMMNNYPFPDWMKAMEESFLSNMQELHDYMGHWDEKGISDFGWVAVKRICDEHNLNFKYIKSQINLN